MNLQTYLWRYFYIACLIPLIAGCIIPIPYSIRDEVTENEVKNIWPGITTRTEIEFKLGKPNVLDETMFAVYRLSEGRLDSCDIHDCLNISVDETYDLTFSYDDNGVVKEFRYETILGKESADINWIEDQFPGQSVEIMEDDEYPEIDISRLGNWITVVSPNKLVFHEIEGQHIEIDRRNSDYHEHFGDDDCLQKFQTIGEQGSDNKYMWLSTATDKTPFYRLCKPANALAISDDGSLLAFSWSKDLELWSSARGQVRSRTASTMTITDLSFGPENKFLVSIGTRLNFNLFAADRDSSNHSSVVDIWSLPWLRRIASIEREVFVQDIAISNDGKLLGLASSTHVEIWERIKSGSEAGKYSWPFKLTKLIPKPVFIQHYNSGQRYRQPGQGGSLRFSSDGKYLINVDKLLHVWDTRNGKLVTRLGAEFGFLNAAIYKDKEIIAVGATDSFFSRGEGAKFWKIPLASVINQFDDENNPGIVPVSNLGLQPSDVVETHVAGGNTQSEPTEVADDPTFSSESPLNEEQLLSKVVGNTLMGRNNNVGKWAEYYEPSKVGESNGKIYGKTKRLYSGSWKIDGSVMCFYYQGSDADGCWMLALDRNKITWYKPNGEKDESEFPTMLIPGNPNKF